MRIAFGGYEHETNNFSTIPVSAERLDRLLRRGEDLVTAFTEVKSMVGGVLDECRALEIQAVPTVYGEAGPCAATVQEGFEAFLQELADRMWAVHCEAPLDAIALTIHGAGVAQGYPDIETAQLRVLREKFGPDMPIGMVLDLHGNLTPEMMALSDITVGFQCYPHTDTYDCGRLLIRLLHEQHKSGKRLHQALVQLPWHIAPAFGETLSGPAHDVMAFNQQLVRERPEVRDVTFFHGFPYADIPHCHVAVTAMAETQEAADAAALEVARTAWNDRHTFRVQALSPAEAFDKAEQAGAFPVVINESSDNPGGGAPGDGTFLLREMLKRNLPGSAFGHICDPEVAQLAAKAGVGSTISCLLGAKTDKLHGEPIALENAYVKAICDGKFVNVSPMGGGGVTNLGLSVRLQVGNVDIVVSSRPRQTMCKGPYEMVGINYTQMRYLGLKSSQHFKGWWKDHAGAIVTCDPPGIHCGDLSVFDYQYADRNYFPFTEPEWEPEL